MDKKLNFYEVKDEYIEYLSKYDSNIMNSKIKERKFKRKYIGILFEINNVLYIAPLSSYKEKHNKMKERIDFIKIGNKSVINLNNMFPVNEKNIERVDLERERDENYRQLLRNEYNLCVPKFKRVIKNANALYKQVVKYNMPIKQRCCNFKFLESICIEYNKNDCNYNIKNKHKRYKKY